MGDKDSIGRRLLSSTARDDALRDAESSTGTSIDAVARLPLSSMSTAISELTLRRPYETEHVLRSVVRRQLNEHRRGDVFRLLASLCSNSQLSGAVYDIWSELIFDSRAVEGLQLDQIASNRLLLSFLLRDSPLATCQSVFQASTHVLSTGNVTPILDFFAIVNSKMRTRQARPMARGELSSLLKFIAAETKANVRVCSCFSHSNLSSQQILAHRLPLLLSLVKDQRSLLQAVFGELVNQSRDMSEELQMLQFHMHLLAPRVIARPSPTSRYSKHLAVVRVRLMSMSIHIVTGERGGLDSPPPHRGTA